MSDSRFSSSFTSLTCAALLALASFSSLAQTLRSSPGLSLPRPGLDSSQRSADFIVAVVNNEPITNNEVRSRMLQVEQQLSARGAPIPPREQLSREVLERLISERAQVQLARDSGLRVDDAAIDGAIQNVARQNQLSVAQLRQRLREDGIDFNSFRNNLRDELLLTRIREREVEPRVKISDADLSQFIREQRDNPSASTVEINLSQILIAVPEGATDAQLAPLQAKAQRALERARAGEDFAQLARELSDAPDRSNGGQLGLRSTDRYPELFVNAAQNLRTGGLAGPVRSGAGFHVLKVIEKRQAGLDTLTLTQTRARHILLRLNAQLTESAAVQRLTQLRQRLVAGGDFAAAARENSQDGSAREGGDLGWANPGQFVPEFEEAMNALAPGQISEPLVSRFGVHLIQVQERRNRQLSEREQREAARAALRDKKLDEAYLVWAQEVRARAYVELREPLQ